MAALMGVMDESSLASAILLKEDNPTPDPTASAVAAYDPTTAEGMAYKEALK